MLEHIDQVGPLLRKHAETIAVLQAGFIGTYGEWYYSDFFVDDPSRPWIISAAQYASRREVVQALADAVPGVPMQIRTPQHKRAMTGTSAPLTEGGAFGESLQARLGHHNDCFLVGSDDIGTYQNESERALVRAEAPFVPVGGETCNVDKPTRFSCAEAEAELALYGWSFMSRTWYEGAINR